MKFNRFEVVSGTYKEIKMFMEGKRLDEIEKLREEEKGHIRHGYWR